MAGSILLPSRFTAQPQYAAPVDWSNPLCRELEYLMLGSVRTYEPTRLAITRSGAITYNPTPGGVGSIFGDVVYDTYLLPSGSTTGGTTNWTIAALLMPTALSGSNANVNGNVVASVTEAPNTAASWDRSLITQNTTHEWRGYLFDGAGRLATSTAQATVGRLDKVIITCNGSTLFCCVDGYADASVGVSSNGYNAYTSAEFCVGDPVASGASPTVAIPLILRTRTFWDATMRREFFTRPFQVLKAPPRRVFFDTGAAGGPTTYTYTPTGGITFSGVAGLSKTKDFTPSGGVTFSGAAALAKTKDFTPFGGITFSGDASTSYTPGLVEYIYIPSGGIVFSGAAETSGPRATAEEASGGWEVFSRRRKTRRELEQEERLSRLPAPVQEIVEQVAQEQAETTERTQKALKQAAIAKELRTRLAQQDLQFRKEYAEVLRGEIERLLYEAEEEKVIGLFLEAM